VCWAFRGGPVGDPLQSHERVCLIGTQGIPDILVARTDRDTGRTL